MPCPSLKKPLSPRATPAIAGAYYPERQGNREALIAADQHLILAWRPFATIFQ
jgi:hypothetical protein